jgi:hypothetical protein
MARHGCGPPPLFPERDRRDGELPNSAELDPRSGDQRERPLTDMGDRGRI